MSCGRGRRREGVRTDSLQRARRGHTGAGCWWHTGPGMRTVGLEPTAEAAWAPETGLGGLGDYAFYPAVKGTTKGPRVTSWTDQEEHPGDSVASGSAVRPSARHTCASTGPAGQRAYSALRVSVGENCARSLTAVCAKAGHRDFAEG